MQKNLKQTNKLSVVQKNFDTIEILHLKVAQKGYNTSDGCNGASPSSGYHVFSTSLQLQDRKSAPDYSHDLFSLCFWLHHVFTLFVFWALLFVLCKSHP